MTPYKLIMVLLILFLYVSVICQTEKSLKTETEIDFFTDDLEDIDTHLEFMDDLRENSLDLNMVTLEELMELGLLTPFQADNIIEYRAKLGPFIDMHEIQAIPSIHKDLAQKLCMYFMLNDTVKDEIRSKDLVQNGKSEIYLKFNHLLEKPQGYDSLETAPKYEGSKDFFSIKWKYSFRDKIKLGVLTEKDAGESFFTKSNKYGFDHYSVYLTIKDIKPWIKEIYIGDYKINFGQGLTAYSGYRAGRAGQMINISNSGRIFNKHSSSAEFGFFRGLAGLLHFNKLELAIFSSFKKVDTRLTQIDSTLNTGYEITSFSTTGYHRSNNEIDTEKNMLQADLGGRLSFTHKKFNAGFNLIYTNFEFPVNKANEPYKKHLKFGKQISNQSVDLSYNYKNLYIAGEIARFSNNSLAHLYLIQLSISSRFDLAFSYRNYSEKYYTHYGKGFGLAASTSNEKGLFITGLLRINQTINIQFMADLWRRPWLSYQLNAPSYGYEYFLKLVFKKKRHYEIYGMLNYSLKQEMNDRATLNFTKSLSDINKLKIRVHLSYKVSKYLELRNRIESQLIFGKHASTGILLYQDIIFKSPNYPYSITARFASFDCPDFETRIYAYENDLLNSFSVPAYYKKGNRFYINARFKISKLITIESRFSRSFYHEDVEISSGADQILDNKKTNIKLQLKLKF